MKRKIVREAIQKALKKEEEELFEEMKAKLLEVDHNTSDDESKSNGS